MTVPVLPGAELRAGWHVHAERQRPADSETATGTPTSTASSRAPPSREAPPPARPSLYGHGLFGDASEVASSGQRDLADTYNFVLCATDEIGMSQSDLGSAAAVTSDISNFPKLADRLQQGLWTSSSWAG